MKTAGKLTLFGLALRNLRGKSVRASILMLSVSVVTGMLFGATIVATGIQNALGTGINRLGADILVVPEKSESEARAALLSGEPSAFYMHRGVIDSVRAVEGVKNASPQVFVKPLAFTCCYNVDVFLAGFDPETDFTVKPWLEKHLDGRLKINEIITGSDIPVIEGDTIPFFGSSYKVAGIMEPTGMNIFDRSVFMTMEAAYQMAEHSGERAIESIEVKKDQISAVLVQVSRGIEPERVAIRIEHAVTGVKAIPAGQVISSVRKQMMGVLRAIFGVGAAIWAIVLVLIGFIFYMIVNERQREIGLLMAMGAKRSQILRLLLTEASVVSVSGGVLGIMGSGLVLALFKSFIKQGLRIPYLAPSASMLLTLAASAVLFAWATGLAASAMPAVYASRVGTYEVIRKAE